MIGQNYVVRILSTLDRELLKPSASVALHRHSNALVDILPPEADSSISMLGSDEKPDVKYSDIGGMDMQKQEIREAVELPLVQVSDRVSQPLPELQAALGGEQAESAAEVTDGPLPQDWYRPTPRCSAVRSAW